MSTETETTTRVPGSCKHGTPPTKNRMGFMVVTCIDCKFEREDAERARAAAAEQKIAAERQSLTGDERRMNARFSSNCSVCGQLISAGSTIAYAPSSRSARHIGCAGKPQSAGRDARRCYSCGVGERAGIRWEHDGGGWIHADCAN